MKLASKRSPHRTPGTPGLGTPAPTMNASPGSHRGRKSPPTNNALGLYPKGRMHKLMKAIFKTSPK